MGIPFLLLPRQIMLVIIIALRTRNLKDNQDYAYEGRYQDLGESKQIIHFDLKANETYD